MYDVGVSKMLKMASSHYPNKVRVFYFFFKGIEEFSSFVE